MAIAASAVPFELTFTLAFMNYEKSYTASFYETSEQEFYEQDAAIDIPENVPFEVLFESHSVAKLYMDGLENVLECKEDEEGTYLFASSMPIDIYRIERDEYYPYIPGLYQLRVNVTHKNYYAWLKISPKQMNEAQLEKMREEVESELCGLAQDIVHHRHELIGKIPPNVLYPFLILEQRFSMIMATINDLYRTVNFQIKKEYQLVPQEKSKVIDEVTIRYRVQYPDTENLIKVPIKRINYDLPENRLAKQIIIFFIEKLNEFIFSIEQIETIDNRNEENVYIEKALKMKRSLRWIQTAPWYTQVSSVKDYTLPDVMTKDARYRSLYQVQREIYKELNEEKETQAYQWKRTDKLYEIWGFLQFIKLLQKMGFERGSDWFQRREHTIVTNIPSGTMVIFRKNTLTLQLVYDGKIPSASSYTNELAQPLYTSGTNNCPDGRMDVYDKYMYIGSLLFDFKYRPKKSIWDYERIITNSPSQTMKQLISYAFNCQSAYLFGEQLHVDIKNILRPVSEVWALYPSPWKLSMPEFYSDHHVRLMELSPMFDNSYLVEELNNTIKRMVQRKKNLLER